MALLPSTALAAPVTYAVDPAETEIVAITRPAGLLSGVSHAHVILARDVSGVVVYDPDAPEQSRVELRLPAASLENDDPALRRKFGQKKTLGEGDRRKVGETMRSGGQLDAERYPEISFASQHVKRLDDGSLELSGVLRIHGVEAPLSLPVKVAVADGVLRGRGSARIGQRTFGIEPYSTGAGTIRNADGVELEITLVAREAAAPPGSSP